MPISCASRSSRYVKRVFAALACAGFLCTFSPAAGGDEIWADGRYETYVARLSGRDHYTVMGHALEDAASVLRQDRANFHIYGYRDAEDEDDDYFPNDVRRARMARLLARGRPSAEVLRRIVGGSPLVRVDVYRDYIHVTLLD
jgi:hypothetical protein